MTDKEVIKQALEALELNVKLTLAFVKRNGLDFTDDIARSEELAAKLRAALEAKEQKQEARQLRFSPDKCSVCGKENAGIHECPAQPAPAVQQDSEPVAWMDADGNFSDWQCNGAFSIPLYTTPYLATATNSEPVGTWVGDCVEWTENPYKFKEGQKLYTAPQPQPITVPQEPIGWQFYDDGKWHYGMEINNHRANTEAAGIPTRNVYAAPEAPAVQPLTEKRIKQLWVQYAPEIGAPLMFARAIEADHGIKETK